MGEGQMKKILAVGKEISMKKDQQIIKEGQAANGVYILRSGSVELLTAVEKDSDLPISILRDPVVGQPNGPVRNGHRHP